MHVLISFAATLLVLTTAQRAFSQDARPVVERAAHNESSDERAVDEKWPEAIYERAHTLRTAGVLVMGAGILLMVGGSFVKDTCEPPGSSCHYETKTVLMTFGVPTVITGGILAIIGNRKMNDALKAQKAIAIVPTLTAASAGLAMSGSF